MTFKPLSYHDVYIEQPHDRALQILEDNNIQWIYQSTVFDHNMNKSRKFDIGFFKDFGIVQIECIDNKVSFIKLHLNWFCNDKKFTGASFSINAHYSFPNGQGAEYKACNVETNYLFRAIEEIQDTGHTVFPFLTLNFIPSHKIFPNIFQPYLSEFIGAKDNHIQTLDYFLSLLPKDNREIFGDPLSEKYGTNHNSSLYKRWNDLNSGNQKCLNTFNWNDIDQQFNIAVSYILRTYDELFYDDQHMAIIENFIKSPLFTHKMECGLNITHVLALVQFQSLHELIYSQFVSLPLDTQSNLINTTDQMGLTLPLLFIHSQLNHIEDVYDTKQQYKLLLERLNTYSSLPGFKDSLTTSKCTFLDIVNFNKQFPDILHIVENSGYKIQDTMHVYNSLFSQYYRYDYQIKGQHNIIEHLKNVNNITLLTSNKKDFAKFIHHYWLEEQTAPYMIDKQHASKKMKI